MHLIINKKEIEDSIKEIFSFDSCDYIQQSINLVFKVSDLNEEKIMRLSPQDQNSKDNIYAECQWIQSLKDAGHNVCNPLPYKGKLVNSVELLNEKYWVTFWKNADGKKVEHNDLGEELFETIGKSLGEYHQMSKFSSEVYNRPNWTESPFLTEYLDKYLGKEDQNIKEIAKNLTADLLRDKQNENFGLIHSDFTFSNFFITDNGLSVFDFDNCEYGYFAHDIATTLHDCTFSLHRKKNREEDRAKYFSGPKLKEYQVMFWNSFLKGYSSIIELPELERKKIHKFHRLREIVIYVHFNELWADCKHKEPFCDYLKEDRVRIENGGWEFYLDL